jgi:hypothetical protein
VTFYGFIKDGKKLKNKEEGYMKVIQGFPATSQDDYQLNLLTLIKHAARSFAQQEIVQLLPPSEDVKRTTYRNLYETHMTVPVTKEDENS